jgi:hypothetical protein
MFATMRGQKLQTNLREADPVRIEIVAPLHHITQHIMQALVFGYGIGGYDQTAPEHTMMTARYQEATSVIETVEL